MFGFFLKSGVHVIFESLGLNYFKTLFSLSYMYESKLDFQRKAFIKNLQSDVNLGFLSGWRISCFRKHLGMYCVFEE